MSSSPRVLVHGEDGLRGSTGADALTRDRGAVEVLLDDGRTLVVPVLAFQKRGDNSLFLPLGPKDLPVATSHAEKVQDEEVVVSVVAEEAQWSKRIVETGIVRIRKSVREHEQVIDEPLYREEIQVERIPVNRPVDAPVGRREEGDTTIFPIFEEVLVVEKRLMLREELRITRRRVEYREPQSVTLRAEEVEVERIASGGNGSIPDGTASQDGSSSPA